MAQLRLTIPARSLQAQRRRKLACWKVLVAVSAACSAVWLLGLAATWTYPVSRKELEHNPGVFVDPGSEIKMPEIGVGVLSRGSGSGYDLWKLGLLEVAFYQSVVHGDGSCGECPGTCSNCTWRVQIPVEECCIQKDTVSDVCRELRAPGALISQCPQWGNIVTSQKINEIVRTFVPTEKTDAAYPRLEGAYLDDTYAYLEATVSLNLTKTLGARETTLDNLRKFMGGELKYSVGMFEYQEHSLPLGGKLRQTFKSWSSSIKLDDFFVSTIDIPVVHREITQGSTILDIPLLKTKRDDVIIEKAEIKLENSLLLSSLFDLQQFANSQLNLAGYEPRGPFEYPEEGMLQISKAQFHLHQTRVIIKMTPPCTLCGVLGFTGGISCVAYFFNAWLSRRKSLNNYQTDVSKA